MATPTYIPIATTTLTASAASVTFGSIPQDYRDLVLVISGTSTANTSCGVRLNGDSGSNYSYVLADGNGSSAGSGAGTLSFAAVGAISTTQSVNIYQIMDYSATDKHTTMLGRSSQGIIQVRMAASRWANNAAVTTLQTANVTLQTGTVVSLYGIAS